MELSLTGLGVWPSSSTTMTAVSWSMTWLMVTIMPRPIRALMSSVALIDIFCASSPTVIVSGITTSRTTGAVGISNAWRVGWVRTTGRDFCFLRLRPALSLATCSSSRLLRPRSRRPPRPSPRSPRLASGRREGGEGGAGATGFTGGAGGVAGAAPDAAPDAAPEAAGATVAGSGAGSGSAFGVCFFFSGSRSLRSASSFSRTSASALRVSSSSC